MTFPRIHAGVDDNFEVPDLGLVSLMTLWMVCQCPEVALFKIWLKSVDFEGIKNNDFSRLVAGVDDDFDGPDWGWCPW